MSAANFHFEPKQRSVEFTHKPVFEVITRTTGNIDLSNQAENGDTLNGITLSTGNFFLAKDQTTTSQNGIYVVQASGAAVRHTSFDTAAELSKCLIWVTGTKLGANLINELWYQVNTLTAFSDTQSWVNPYSALPITHTWEAPGGIYTADGIFCGGGGGGGKGGDGNNSVDLEGGGGGGGAASPRRERRLQFSPGDEFEIQLGFPGKSGQDGTNTIITNTTTGEVYTFPGANCGGSAAGNPSIGGAGGLGLNFANFVEYEGVNGAAGGNGFAPGDPSEDGDSIVAFGIEGDLSSDGGLRGTVSFGGGDSGAGGGAGAPSYFGRGGDGGNGGNQDANNAEAGENAPSTSYGAGGGGGGGGGETGSPIFYGALGGFGGPAYVKLEF